MFGQFFGIEKTGVYVFSTKIVLVPLNLLSLSFGKVFFQTISEKISLIRKQTNKYFIGLLLLSIPVILVLLFGLNSFFDILIDKRYTEAKYLIQLLYPWFILTFLSSPFSYVLTTKKNEKISFILLPTTLH